MINELFIENQVSGTAHHIPTCTINLNFLRKENIEENKTSKQTTTKIQNYYERQEKHIYTVYVLHRCVWLTTGNHKKERSRRNRRFKFRKQRNLGCPCFYFVNG